MKKIILVFTLFLFFVSFCEAVAEGDRYIVFFAESADIPETVADKILYSKRFCMTAPIVSGSSVPASIEELVSSGKIEPSLIFNPEPVFPIMATVYGSGAKKADRQGFNDFIVGGMKDFSDGVNRERFGVFLNSGDVSHNILYYFADLKLQWINIDNMETSFKGANFIDGMITFSIYKNFPTAQKDIMKWLSARKENIIPVLLTKKHLDNAEFMGYIINLFDTSKYIKPAVPLYVSLLKRDMIGEKQNVSFDSVSVSPSVMTKLYSAVSAINSYKGSSDFVELSYKDAQSELVYLCSRGLLKGIASNKTGSQRMFDAAYNNIFRLIGTEAPSDKDLSSKKEEITVSGNLYVGTEEVLHSEAKSVNFGASIKNDGLLKNLTVVAKDGTVNFSFSFEKGGWDEKVSFVDIYIDMNNFEGAGSTAMLDGINGYLTPASAWEYALRVSRDKIYVYRHSAESAVLLTEMQNSGKTSFSVLQKYIKGNPDNWGYQAVCIGEGENKTATIEDFFVQSSQSRASFLSVKPFQIPAVRIIKR